MTTLHARAAGAASRPFLRSPRRVALAALGLLCVGLGVIGVFVPGLPTTVFLIAASYLFTRSCPVLEERLLRARIFRPYLKYLDGNQPMPLRLRVRAIAVMWTAVGLSLLVLRVTDHLTTWCAVGTIGAALAGTVVIARIRRGRKERRPSPAPPGA